MGLVVFAGVPLLQCPLTLDYGALLEFLEQVEPGMTGTENTAIGTAIAAAAGRLKKSTAKSKIIILVTDGRSNSGEVDPLTAAKAAEAVGIKIYTIGVGIRGQSVIPVDTPWGKQLAPIQDDLDEPSLMDIAHVTGGRYYRATSPKELEQIYAEIDGLEKSEVEGPAPVEFQDRYLPWLMMAMALASLGLGLSLSVWRTVP
jgi:Ca-activated chloride channel family protein